MDDSDLQNILDDITFLAAEKDSAMIRNILIGNHPADIASIVTRLPDQTDRYVFSLLDADTASDVIVELDDVTRERLVSDLRHDRLSEIVDEMDSDDATDFVSELPDEVAEKILDAIDDEDSAEVKKLLQHEDDTAGGIMALEFVSVYDNETIDEAIREIRVKAEEVNQIYNVYVTNRTGELVGLLPLKRVLLARANQNIGDIMNRDVIKVPVDMDQEEVANIFRKYDLVALPVVDAMNRLVGRITVDDIVDVMEEEASEDIQAMAGIADDDDMHEKSVFKISFGRLPWLLVGFGGQLLAAMVLKQFETPLREIFIATFFIPLMMAMGGNSGIQAATIVVRGLALGELSASYTLARLLREVKVSLVNGSICGVLLFGVVSVLDTPNFALVLAVSMIAVIINASFIGASIPFVLRRFGVDPAIATGPLITTFNDIIGLSIYLGLVTTALNVLGR